MDLSFIIVKIATTIASLFLIMEGIFSLSIEECTRPQERNDFYCLKKEMAAKSIAYRKCILQSLDHNSIIDVFNWFALQLVYQDLEFSTNC